MGLGDYAGYCRASIKNPTAQAECDRCSRWYHLDRLRRQMEWQGAQLIWTGYLVCDKCDDIPFEQNKVLILPVDPLPRLNPRPSREATPLYYAGFTPPTSFDNQGMTNYIVGQGQPAGFSTGGFGAGAFPVGASLPPNYPTVKANLLSQVAILSGIPTPNPVNDQSVTLTKGVPATALVANASRTWMLLYNPSQCMIEFALGSTTWNGALNLPIGPGEAWFWANAQDLTQVYQGVVAAVAQTGNAPLWCWDSSAGGLGDDGGVLYVPFPPADFPTSPTGLNPGDVYLVPNVLPGNQYAVGIVGPTSPNPTAPAVYLSSITAAGLLALGGGNLPLTNPGIGTQQLWNNGGLISVA